MGFVVPEEEKCNVQFSAERRRGFFFLLLFPAVSWLGWDGGLDWGLEVGFIVGISEHTVKTSYRSHYFRMGWAYSVY